MAKPSLKIFQRYKDSNRVTHGVACFCTCLMKFTLFPDEDGMAVHIMSKAEAEKEVMAMVTAIAEIEKNGECMSDHEDLPSDPEELYAVLDSMPVVATMERTLN